MTYKEEQRQLFDQIESSWKRGEVPSTFVDPVKDYANDERQNLGCFALADSEIKNVIVEKIINPLKNADSRQYYFLPESLHVTIQNIRTSHKPALFSERDIEIAKGVLADVIPKYGALTFNFEGIFELPTSISIRAYCNENFRELVRELRAALIDRGIPDDKKYASETVFGANMTVCRFTSQPNQDFYTAVKLFKTIYIAKMQAKEIFLISSNPGFHPSKTKVFALSRLK